eukprot:CAMPEP_0172940514 /NCGR_PEP_ID=MMETSP1075-20121228/224073_1 /TAXON_ID=2916 /ORGANISM="Ceratium fusus, Strain PA161109" /LENGTH=264 /DNA_ID=CAMNT_0013801913 /DNA_START=68 /DNA_END=863 /DNA_ORIENTATION=-
MARATQARAKRGIIVSMLGACLLVWSQLTLFVGLQPVPVRGEAPAKVSLFGKAKDGIFTPIVQGAKVVVGEAELKKIRANVIKMHGELMGNFIGTANSDFGDFALEKLFEAADGAWGDTCESVIVGKAKDGIFTPLVQGAKVIVGEAELKKIRANVIKMHGELMGNFIGTANSDFGDFALEKLFEAADEDGSGQLDKEELKVALNKLGFSWVDDDKVDKVATKGDKDGDGLIDLEEFKKMAPMVLKQNLMKLAKENGSELGMLS